jgi:hypothetical protein
MLQHQTIRTRGIQKRLRNPMHTVLSVSSPHLLFQHSTTHHFFTGPVVCLLARYAFFSSYTATGGGRSPYSAATSLATPSVLCVSLVPLCLPTIAQQYPTRTYLPRRRRSFRSLLYRFRSVAARGQPEHVAQIATRRHREVIWNRFGGTKGSDDRAWMGLQGS